MKKILVGVLCAAAVSSAAVPAIAAGTANTLIAPNPLIEPQVQYSLKINGKNVDLGSRKIVEMQDQVMVPLRLTAETLGFTVTWDGEKQAVHIDNGKMQADLTIGLDTYAAYSSKAIGMTTPQHLGAAPAIIDCSTYVPADFFKIVLTDPGSVSIKDHVVSISSSQTSSSAGIANPAVSYATPDEARTAVGFSFALPAALPEGYQMQDIRVIGNALVEIVYVKGDSRIVYRTARGINDISGDYNAYDSVKEMTVGNTEVTVKGQGDGISLAAWAKDGVSFSLFFDAPVHENALSAAIQSIQ